ncbi:hypothetical protein BD769DRAFT_1384676 [Suillus cothurnatus]|nr:hypothetical protein BD769DRAFT_1384676 [Suillus cothurnatus]
MLDAYIGLIASQKLQTELYVLLFLLKDHVYSGDLWELIGKHSIEVKQEEMLCRHQYICTGGDGGRHALVEQVLIDERRRCQMEVSLYSQAIDRLEQHWIQSSLQAGRPTYISLNCLGSSMLLSSAWVTSDIQERFFKAFQVELTIQAELMLHHAQAEMELYRMAMENSYICSFCDNSSSMSPNPIVPCRLPKEGDPIHNEDNDNEDGDGTASEDHDDIDVW